MMLTKNNQLSIHPAPLVVVFGLSLSLALVAASPQPSQNPSGKTWRATTMGSYTSPHHHRKTDPQIESVRKLHFSDAYKGPDYSVKRMAEFISKAHREGQTKVTIPPGIYHSYSKRGCHLKFKNLRNLEIYAKGVLLLCHSPSRALQFSQCNNVKLHGLVVDYSMDGLPFTQGSVIALRGKHAVVKLHKAYPRLGKELKTIRKVAAYHSGSLLLKERVKTQYEAKFELIDQDTVEIKNMVSGVGVGDYITMVCRQELPHGLYVDEGDEMQFYNVTLHSAPMFAILDVGSKASVYKGVKISPGPIPDGGDILRLKSGAQDGIHVKRMKGSKGVRIENCLIDSHSDDGIAITTPYAMIIESKGDSAVVAFKNGNSHLSVGDQLRYTRSKDMAVQGAFEVLDIERVSDQDDLKRLQQVKMSFPLSPFLRNQALKHPVFWRIRLRGTGSLGAQDFLCLSSGNQGAVIKGNTIRNHRARAMMLKTGDCIIENNTVFHSQMSGVTFSVEKYWMEGDYGDNITIRGNRFIDCGYAWENRNKATTGMINFVGMGDKEQFAPVGQYKNIVIEDNLIDGAYHLPFVITSSSGVSIQRNKIIRSHFVESKSGSKVGVVQSSMIWLKNCRDVTVKENQYLKPGKFYSGREIGSPE